MGDQETILRLPQERETLLQEQQRARFTYRYAYERSADSQAGDDRGQDYLVLREDGKRLAFAVCDGVSQSFMGDVAARILGDALVEWLWQNGSSEVEEAEVRGRLDTFLTHLARTAATKVRAAPLPPHLSPMLHEVLEQKRQLGSESMFAAGLVDSSADRLMLTWMGDARLRLWAKDGERTEPEAFKTNERWSTRHGPVGEIHTMITSLNQVQRLVIYSDGLAALDGFVESPSVTEVTKLIGEARAAPTSDDITFLEIKDIKLGPPAEQRRKVPPLLAEPSKPLAEPAGSPTIPPTHVGPGSPLPPSVRRPQFESHRHRRSGWRKTPIPLGCVIFIVAVLILTVIVVRVGLSDIRDEQPKSTPTPSAISSKVVGHMVD